MLSNTSFLVFLSLLAIGFGTAAETAPEQLDRKIDLYFKFLVKADSRGYGPYIELVRKPEAFPFLKQYFTNSDSTIRGEALRLILESEMEKALPFAMTGLKDENLFIASNAMYFLRSRTDDELRAFATELIPLLITYAQEANGKRLNTDFAIEILVRLAGPDIMPELRKIKRKAATLGYKFNFRDTSKVEACRIGLAKLGDSEAKEEIRSLLKSSDVLKLLEGVNAVKGVGAEMARTLLPLLEDRRPTVNVAPAETPAIARVCDYAAMAVVDIFKIPDAEFQSEESLRNVRNFLENAYNRDQ
jgi:HEAT repeat protein